ncbi:MAG: Fur family transcriptional regulator [Dehalococcoidales bacterium]|nr:Fur family transcriptional regulator [Dehalococcoidales bacterium]
MPVSLTNRDLSQNKNRQLLNTAGLRNTAQRSLVLDIIRRGHGHLDADEVHRQAKRKQPRISLSTVYRTLQKLKGLGLIEELHFDEAHHHYEIKPPTEHHHLLCLGCGKIIEFKYPLARLIKKNAIEAKDFEITGSEVRMTGYCADCHGSKK